MPQRTEGLVVSSAGARFDLAEVILDELRPDEVLVEIHATGICHTDIACADGKLPADFPCILGHEGKLFLTLTFHVDFDAKRTNIRRWCCHTERTRRAECLRRR